MKLLVVDDSRAARMMIASLIQEYDREIALVEAADGRDGVELFKKEKPDVTLLDLTMPVMDGYDALKEMKNLDSTRAVVVLTADIQKKAVEKCLSLGADAVLKKLPQKEELFSQLDLLFKRDSHE